MIELGLTLLFGVGVGAAWADLALTQRPFASRPVGRVSALVLLAIAIGFTLPVGEISEWSSVPLALIATGAAAGAAVTLVAAATAPEPSYTSTDLRILPDREFHRAKQGDDRWVLVFGTPGGHRTEFVHSILAAAQSVPGPLRLLHAPRSAERGRVRLSELTFGWRDGSRRLRLWEAEAVDAPGLPAMGDMDAVILVLDATRLRTLEGSFPRRLAPRPAELVDGNALVHDLALAVAGAGGRNRRFWTVFTKTDLLRFSVARPLIEFPLAVGPGWYRQMQGMQLPDRRRLAVALGVEAAADVPAAFEQGTASPLLAYVGSERDYDRSFGAGELLQRLLEALVIDPAPARA